MLHNITTIVLDTQDNALVTSNCVLNTNIFNIYHDLLLTDSYQNKDSSFVGNIEIINISNRCSSSVSNSSRRDSDFMSTSIKDEALFRDALYYT